MAMNRTFLLSAAFVGALAMTVPAAARHGGGGGGPGGGSMGGGSMGAHSMSAPQSAGPSSVPSGGPSHMHGTFNSPRSFNGPSQWSGGPMQGSRNRANVSGGTSHNWQWNSNHVAGDFGRDGRHHRHHHRGGFFPFGVYAYDYGYDYPYGYYDDGYVDDYYGYPAEDCYVRRVRVHGHWVRRRFCDY